MTLTLTILRDPKAGDLEAANPETRQIAGGTLSIGRAPENDWVLPDPERHLSKRHCVVKLRGEAWELADFSANGTFLNRDADPVGSGRVRDLRDGDRLRLGAYEMAVRIAAAAAMDSFGDFAPPLTPFEPLPNGSYPGLPQADHSPGVDDAFRPPQPCVLLAEDWDLLGGEPPPGAPPPPPALAGSPVAERVAASITADLMAAFLRGAGLGDVRPADPERAMAALGAAFRAMAGGLREAMVTRASVKGEFRIAQTMIRAQGNNPLKFAASEDDALLALLGVGRRTDMSPAESVSEALGDIRLHDLATTVAMQSAIRELLRAFAPAKLRDAAGQSGLNVLPMHRKLHAWDLFEAQHASLTQALSDDFDSVFGRAFARAYEQALREAQPARSRG